MGLRWDPDGKRNRGVVKPATLQGMLGRENLQGESQWDLPFFSAAEVFCAIKRISRVEIFSMDRIRRWGAFRKIACGRRAKFSTEVPLTNASLRSTIALLNRRLYEIPREQRTSRTVESGEGAF